MMAELMGKATGYCKGRGGSMHIADVEKGNLGSTGIVGGNIPIGTGAALAEKLKGSASFSATSATAPPTPAASTRRSTWAQLFSAGFPSSTFAKTTSMA